MSKTRREFLAMTLGWAGVRGLPDWPYDSLKTVDERRGGTAGLHWRSSQMSPLNGLRDFSLTMPLVPARAAVADPLFTHKPFRWRTME